MTRTMSRFALPLFAFALVVGPLASCGGSDILNLDQNWALQTISGAPLPFTVPNASHDIVIFSGVAHLNSDNTYTMTFTGTLDGANGTVASDNGGWAIGSSTFTFHSSSLHTDYIAALVGSSFTATIPGQMVSSTNQSFQMTFTKTQ